MLKKNNKMRIFSLLLAGMLLCQSPMTVLAEELTAETEASNSVEATEEISAEQDVVEETGNQADEEEFSGETLTDSVLEGDTADEDSEMLFEEETTEDLEGSVEDLDDIEADISSDNEENINFEFTDGSKDVLTADTEEITEDPITFTVTVSISKDGEFLDDKNGEVMAGREVVLTGQSSYTIEDVCRFAHEQYYKGGADAGYSFNWDEKSSYSYYGVIEKLWGYNRSDVPKITHSLNNNNFEMRLPFTTTVEEGDTLHFYIQQQKDMSVEKFSFFTQDNLTITEDGQAELHLRQFYDLNYSDCENAAIYINGVEQAGIVTDSSGKVTLSGLKANDTPYFITAKKTIDNGDGTKTTAISAAYVYITVFSSTEDTEDYDCLKSVTLKNVTENNKSNEYTITDLSGNTPFIVSSDFVFRNKSDRADMYLKFESTDSILGNCCVYAVYEEYDTSVSHKVKINSDGFVKLPNAVRKGVYKDSSYNYYNQPIKKITIEVQLNGKIIQTCNLPIYYRNYLKSLTLTDSWGIVYNQELNYEEDKQTILATVPENADYFYLEGWGNAFMAYDNEYGKRSADITIDSQYKYATFERFNKFTPAWEEDNTNEYIFTITLPKTKVGFCQESAEYTLILIKGEVDYTPKLTITESGDFIEKSSSIYQGAEYPKLEVTADVLRGDEGKLSYQWYSVTRNQENFYESLFTFDQYAPIEGATNSIYYVPTDQLSNAKAYKCLVTYELDGNSYSMVSDNWTTVEVVPKTTETPVISKQPSSVQLVKGKANSIDLSVTLENPFLYGMDVEYQWYQNTEDNTETGTAIKGAAKNTPLSFLDAKTFSYTASVSGTDKVYYYCKVRFAKTFWLGTNNSPYASNYRYDYSDWITSDVACVQVIEEAMPWDGSGTSSDPYQIKSLTDLEALRDKVNTDGFSFEGMYFEMEEDIELPSDWTLIGALQEGHTDSKNGIYLNPFSGTFDGKNHTVTVENGGLPLFGYVREAVIENLNIYGEKIAGYGLVNNYSVDYGTDGNYNTGCPLGPTIRNVTIKSGTNILKAGLLGGYGSGANTTTIENCTVESGVVIGYSKDESSIGSFAGSLNGVIRNCTSAATVYGASKVGGLAGSKGQSMGSCIIENSSFIGTVSALGNYVGGILGSGYESDSAPNTPVASIKNCYVAGTVSGGTNVGGIFGGEPSCMKCWGNGSGSIANNFFYGTVKGNKNVGSIIGFLKSFDKFQGISNNYYLSGCGADAGIGAVENIITADVDPELGIDYDFDQTKYCFKKSAEEFKDGTVRAGLNSGNYNNWDQGENYPFQGEGAYVISLSISGDYNKKFELGSDIDLSDAVFTVVWSDGSKTNPEWKDITVVGYDKNTRGSQKLQLIYGPVDTTITVDVILPSGDIQVKFTLLGDSVHDSDTDGNTHTLAKGNLETWIPETTYVVDTNTKVVDIVNKALAENSMTCDNEKGNYISAITRNGIKLGEFTNGTKSGWMYTLNGVHPTNAVDEQYLSDGDVVVFHYTDDYINEKHEEQWTWDSDASRHWMICEWCGLKKEGSEAAHTFGSWKNDSDLHWRECNVCGYIDMVSHKFGNWKVTQNATVLVPKIEKQTCSVCGYTATRTGKKLTPAIKVNMTTVPLKVKQSTTALKVSGLAKGDKVVSYKSDNKKIVTVNSKGKITAGKKTGSTKITIKLKSGLTKKITVRVQKSTVKTTKISGLKTKLSIKKGKKYTLKPTLTPLTSGQKISYTSSNKKIATVNAKGVITAKKKGTVTITVKSGSKSKKIKVTVTK